MKINLTQALGWVASTIGVSVSTVFAVMRFAYSDFETQRTNDVYRTQIEKRLDNIQGDLNNLNSKIDRLLSRR